MRISGPASIMHDPFNLKRMTSIEVKKKELRRISELKKTVVNEAVTHGLNPNVPMKFSGVEWLGDIPAHWTTIKLRQILHPFSEKNHPELPLLSVVREQGEIIRDVEDKESNHNFIPDDLSGYKMVKKGQFAMNKMKAWQGSYGISDYTGIVSPAYLDDASLDSNQIYFVNQIVEYIVHNGLMKDMSVLQDAPPLRTTAALWKCSRI